MSPGCRTKEAAGIPLRNSQTRDDHQPQRHWTGTGIAMCLSSRTSSTFPPNGFPERRLFHFRSPDNGSVCEFSRKHGRVYHEIRDAVNHEGQLVTYICDAIGDHRFDTSHTTYSIGCYFRTERQAGASLFLTAPRFRILGRLAGEYAVGIHTEDERLKCLRRERMRRPPISFTIRSLAVSWAHGRGALTVILAHEQLNPLWPEIQSQLLPGQSVFDIPGVVNRAFHARLEKPKVFLRQNFGGLAYDIGVIETEPSVPVLDSFISAELPDSSCTTRPGVSMFTGKTTPAGIPLQPKWPPSTDKLLPTWMTVDGSRKTPG
ncbi:hypothetical protein V8E54_010749 [Elaphomyces granulatus]